MVLGNRHDAVIGRQRDDVAVGPYRQIEMVEQSAQGAIQPDQNVLHLVAARTEMVSSPIECREADREIIRRPTLAKLERVDCRDRQPAEVVVRERALRPLLPEQQVGRTAPAEEGMWERPRPSLEWPAGRRVVLEEIRLVR